VLDKANIATIIVAVVGFFGMWLSQKISARASMQNERVKAEVEAYARAVKMDRETIERQAQEIREFREERTELKRENLHLKHENAKKDVANAALVKQNLMLQDELRKKRENGQQGV
jgi:hypothetical protein